MYGKKSRFFNLLSLDKSINFRTIIALKFIEKLMKREWKHAIHYECS